MRKYFILISIILIILSSACSAIPGLSTKPAVKKTAPPTTPTLIERVQAIESQEVSWETQLSKMQTDINNLKPPDTKTIEALQAQIFTMQQQMDDQLSQIKALQALIKP